MQEGQDSTGQTQGARSHHAGGTVQARHKGLGHIMQEGQYRPDTGG